MMVPGANDGANDDDTSDHHHHQYRSLMPLHTWVHTYRIYTFVGQRWTEIGNREHRRTSRLSPISHLSLISFISHLPSLAYFSLAYFSSSKACFMLLCRRYLHPHPHINIKIEIEITHAIHCITTCILLLILGSRTLYIVQCTEIISSHQSLHCSH